MTAAVSDESVAHLCRAARCRGSGSHEDLASAAVAGDPRHHLGRLGERLAAEHLERLGYEIVERNARTRHGELDLVACDGRTLVFCEVKTRRAGRVAIPFEALGALKQAQVRRLAGAWLCEHPARPRAPEVRFDAIGVTFDPSGHLLALDHIEGAF